MKDHINENPIPKSNHIEVYEGVKQNQVNPVDLGVKNDVVEEDETCQICLEFMDAHDILFPVNCPIKCGFNMCKTCLSNMITSSKAGPVESSDGNVYKTNLTCPNCRSDLSNDISKTLRQRQKSADVAKFGHIPDNELNAHDLRSKYAARSKSMHSMGDEYDDEDMDAFNLRNGIDTTLLWGLESAMTKEEQKFVTSLMTSRGAENLARAAQILHGISNVSSKGTTPSISAKNKHQATQHVAVQISQRVRSTDTNSSKDRITNNRRNYTGRVTRKPTVKRETLGELRKRLCPLPVRMPRMFEVDTSMLFDPFMKRGCPLRFVDDNSLHLLKSIRHSKIIMDVKTETEDSGQPKTLSKIMEGVNSVLRFDNPCGVGTINQESKEDGNTITDPVLDAYSKLEVNWSNNVNQRLIANTVGVEHILSARTNGKFSPNDPTRTSLLLNRKGRIVISSVAGKMSRLGFQVGDVITHIDGEAFYGNSETLKILLKHKWEKVQNANIDGESGNVQIIVNAEDGIAEALYLRNLC
mmetsp:Transcript_10520/g.14851  ORF Transcript_10520/g.14851 Transcript_10520/m.14851 type:complete len:526 (+) Transcript_10520:114-1691(+)